MDWYYAENKERRGPFQEAHLRDLVSRGAIKPETLVWNPSLTGWLPAGQTPLFGAAPAAGGVRSEQCIITGRTFPISQMIETKHGWVSAEGKDAYYQSLREGVAPNVASGVTNARRDGKYVVLPASMGRLPPRCFKTGAPVAAGESRMKTLYWYPPLIALSILISLLIFIILYFVFRKKVVVDLPLSAAGARLHRKHLLIGWGLFVASVAMFVAGFADERLIILLPVGVFTFLAAVIYGILKGSLVRVAKLRNGEAWLSGAGPEFLASLSTY